MAMSALKLRPPVLKSARALKVSRSHSWIEALKAPSKSGNGWPMMRVGAVRQSIGTPVGLLFPSPASHMMLVGWPFAPRSALRTFFA